MNFVLVNGRTPFRKNFCVLCSNPIGEEGYLREHFAGFDAYAAKVPRLLPRLTPAAFPVDENASGGRFSAEQWRHHHEYNALMGAGAIYLALAVRLFLHHHGVMGGLR